MSKIKRKPCLKDKALSNKQMKQPFFYLSLILASSLLWPSLAKSHDGHASSHGVKIEELADSTKMWDGNILPNYPSGQPKIKILRIR
ncbi:MAG: hypothetical protein P8O84_04920, partial [Synechococcus sp. cluster3_bin.96]|nr:hypothetical protein [Synechococcus sp. cluster3_bin.96]